MHEPKTIGAVDAGTNAIRVVVARTWEPDQYVRIHKERWPVRMGASVFRDGTMAKQPPYHPPNAFHHVAELFDQYDVDAWRAVGTSAPREADNSDRLLRQIRRTTDLELDLVDGSEEAELTRDAIRQWLEDRYDPDLVIDIGGGSLELVTFEDGAVADSTSLPLGTVRLMETYDIEGAIDGFHTENLRRHVEATLDESDGAWREREGTGAVGAGGNVEALAEIYAGDDLYGFDSLDLAAMAGDLERVTRLGIRERMETFAVRRDRADVMAIAAIVLATLGEQLDIRRLSAPDVGVREGVLLELSRQVHGADDAPAYEQQRHTLLESCREFAEKFRRHTDHTEHVRELSAQIFDRLGDRHRMGRAERLVLECAALLHEIGYAVQRSGRHKHAAYLIENGETHGLRSRLRQMVAVVVRHHRSAFPAPRHDRFTSLDEHDRPTARKLAAILRIADGLDANSTQGVEGVRVRIHRGRADFILDQNTPSNLPALGATQKGHLFEVAFDLEPRFVSTANPRRTARNLSRPPRI